MPFLVETFHIQGTDPDPLREGDYTFGLNTPEPRYADSRANCPFCGEQMERAINAHRLKIHRVARILGPMKNGEVPFIGSLFPWRTHVFMGCRRCRMGFSMIKSSPHRKTGDS